MSNAASASGTRTPTTLSAAATLTIANAYLTAFVDQVLRGRLKSLLSGGKAPDPRKRPARVMTAAAVIMAVDRAAWAFFGVWVLAAAFNLIVASWRYALPYVDLVAGAGIAALVLPRRLGDAGEIKSTTRGDVMTSVVFAASCVVVSLLARDSVVLAGATSGCLVPIAGIVSTRRSR